MAKIDAFSALRYDTKKVAIRKVVCPPYDVINRSQRKAYIRLSPDNVVKLVLPEKKGGARDYSKASNMLHSLIKKGILKKDDLPSIYVYIKEYKAGKKKLRRCGFLSTLSLKENPNNKVLPHEKIFSKPFMDRVNLMKETRAHLSPIFMVFRDPKAKVSEIILREANRSKPNLDFSFEGVRHKFWKIDRGEFIEELKRRIAKTKVFIADGHHRFAASVKAMEYFNSLPKNRIDPDGYSQTLVYMVSSGDKGLMILPTHRAVKILPKDFSMEYMLKRLGGHFKLSFISYKKVEQVLHQASKKHQCGFVIFYKNRYLYALLKNKRSIKDIGPKDASLDWKNLDVSILHNLVLEKLLSIREDALSHRNIYYYKDVREVIEKVRSGEHKLGILLNPPTMKEVETIAEAGEKMPHKSTYFFPKPLTGLVIHKF